MSRARHGGIRILLPTLRRLHLAELVHLREHAARLEAENIRLKTDNELLENAAIWADDRAEMLQDALNLADHVELGITREGQIGLLVKATAMSAP